jgi:hypothetical protein
MLREKDKEGDNPKVPHELSQPHPGRLLSVSGYQTWTTAAFLSNTLGSRGAERPSRLSGPLFPRPILKVRGYRPLHLGAAERAFMRNGTSLPPPIRRPGGKRAGGSPRQPPPGSASVVRPEGDQRKRDERVGDGSSGREKAPPPVSGNADHDARTGPEGGGLGSEGPSVRFRTVRNVNMARIRGIRGLIGHFRPARGRTLRAIIACNTNWTPYGTFGPVYCTQQTGV